MRVASVSDIWNTVPREITHSLRKGRTQLKHFVISLPPFLQSIFSLGCFCPHGGAIGAATHSSGSPSDSNTMSSNSQSLKKQKEGSEELSLNKKRAKRRARAKKSQRDRGSGRKFVTFMAVISPPLFGIDANSTRQKMMSSRSKSRRVADIKRGHGRNVSNG